MTYILVDGMPVPEPDRLKWAHWFGTQDQTERIVAKSIVGDEVEVSTVFIGLDHRFGEPGPPLLWETMIFGGPHDGETWRYSSREQAKDGHLRVIFIAQNLEVPF